MWPSKEMRLPIPVPASTKSERYYASNIVSLDRLRVDEHVDTLSKCFWTNWSGYKEYITLLRPWAILSESRGDLIFISASDPTIEGSI